MRTKPVIIVILLLLAAFFGAYVKFDGFKTGSSDSGVEDLKFKNPQARSAFDAAFKDWMAKNGYENHGDSWRAVTGKAAFNDVMGVRTDLVVYVKRLSERSYQAWGVGAPTDRFDFVQVFRSMVVREWTEERADEIEGEFRADAALIKGTVMPLGREL